MAANVYQNACLGEEALQELSSLGIQPSETKCTPLGVNSCEGPLDQLLDSYSVFAVPADQPRSFVEDEKILFVEDHGFRVVLKKANQNIPSIVAALDETLWGEVCSLRPEVKYEPLSADEIFTGFDPIQNGQAYSAGDVYYELSPCGDIICLYMANQVILSNEDVLSKSRLLYCANTGVNKGLGHRRSRTPEDFYEVVEIGSDCDFVEVPVKYSFTPLLNDLV